MFFKMSLKTVVSLVLLHLYAVHTTEFTVFKDIAGCLKRYITLQI